MPIGARHWALFPRQPCARPTTTQREGAFLSCWPKPRLPKEHQRQGGLTFVQETGFPPPSPSLGLGTSALHREVCHPLCGSSLLPPDAGAAGFPALLGAASAPPYLFTNHSEDLSQSSAWRPQKHFHRSLCRAAFGRGGGDSSWCHCVCFEGRGTD